MITDQMVDRALQAWFASPPSETDQGLERSMRAALEASGLTAERDALWNMAALSFQWMKAHDMILGFIQADSQRLREYAGWHDKPEYPNPEQAPGGEK